MPEVTIPNWLDQRVLAAGPGFVLRDVGGQRIEIQSDGPLAGVTLGAVKAVDTARNGTIVPAPDPELVIAAVPAGLYQFTLGMLLTCSAGAGGGIRWTLDIPTPPVGLVCISAFQLLGNPAFSATDFQGAQLRDLASPITSDLPQTATFRQQCAMGFLELPGETNVAFSWALKTSVAVDTIVRQGSAMSLVRIK